ncbi:MAG: potassium transporter TrkG [Oscillospiraceae bacterium]
METLYKLADGKVEALEFKVNQGSKVIGVPLKDLKLKPNIIISAIVRGRRTVRPGGDAEVRRGPRSGGDQGRLAESTGQYNRGRDVNRRIICRVLGMILLCLAVLMILPTIAGLWYGENVSHFIITMAIAGAVGFVMTRVKPYSSVIYAKDGFVIVGLGWILMSLFGALPFVISGDIPNYIDAVFETVSGFTTTGASILENVEEMSQGYLFWPSFTHWIGGMGVLVFIMAVLPMSGEHSMHIMRAEVPGPTVGKLVPRVRQTAKILYLIYVVMTAVEVVLLLFGGMSLFDALIHAFGSAGTGGFSNKAASVGAYDSAYIEMVIAVFMALFAINFNLFFLILIGRWREALKSEELHWYLAIIAASVLAIALGIRGSSGGMLSALRHAFFNVSSIISTTGFCTVDYVQWPEYCQWILVILMFCGACAGSTGGGLKTSRVAMIFD